MVCPDQRQLLRCFVIVAEIHSHENWTDSLALQCHATRAFDSVTAIWLRIGALIVPRIGKNNSRDGSTVSTSDEESKSEFQPSNRMHQIQSTKCPTIPFDGGLCLLPRAAGLAWCDNIANSSHSLRYAFFCRGASDWQLLNSNHSECLTTFSGIAVWCCSNAGKILNKMQEFSISNQILFFLRMRQFHFWLM